MAGHPPVIRVNNTDDFKAVAFEFNASQSVPYNTVSSVIMQLQKNGLFPEGADISFEDGVIKVSVPRPRNIPSDGRSRWQHHLRHMLHRLNIYTQMHLRPREVANKLQLEFGGTE